jgi:hypothetical protein
MLHGIWNLLRGLLFNRGRMPEVQADGPMDLDDSPDDTAHGARLDDMDGVGIDFAGGRPSTVLPVHPRLVNLRKAALVKLFTEFKVLPDLTTIIALRELHNDLLEHNHKTDWILDRKPFTTKVQ